MRTPQRLRHCPRLTCPNATPGSGVGSLRIGLESAAATSCRGRRLQPRCRFGRGESPTVTDGPFMEGKEQIGGYAEIDVVNLDEALEMARAWPGRGTVEIRPVVVTH